jgi:hypothetical protein
MLGNHTSPDGTRHQKGSVWHFSDEDGAKLIADGLAKPNDPVADRADETHGAEHEAQQEG